MTRPNLLEIVLTFTGVVFVTTAIVIGCAPSKEQTTTVDGVLECLEFCYEQDKASLDMIGLDKSDPLQTKIKCRCSNGEEILIREQKFRFKKNRTR